MLFESVVAHAHPLPVWPEELGNDRRELLAEALDFLKAHPSVPYVTGGTDASGLDCSGAIVLLLKQVGGNPPRSAHDQYLWLEKLKRLTKVPPDVTGEKDPVFKALQPGDLIFWAPITPAASESPASARMSHVHMYLGVEKDGHAIMIGSSDGRSYRGTKVAGFGITDFKVPKAGSRTRIIAFGPPPPLLPTPAASPDPAEEAIPPVNGSP